MLVYNTVHMYLEVFIDGDKIYELKGEKGSAVKTTGFCWNVISLTKDDAGKEIVFLSHLILMIRENTADCYLYV